MSVHISELTIPRIDKLGGGHWSLKSLSDITVLFGRNGSGKSVMLRAWRDQHFENAHYVIPERTGEIDMQPQFMREEINAASRRGNTSRNFTQDYRRRIIARVQSYFMNRGNYRGETSAPAPPDKIEKLINGLLTDFIISLSADQEIPYRLRRLDADEVISTVDQLSSGEAQLITVALDILTVASMWQINNKYPRTMLIDEPDAHIHPDLQVRFADFVFQVMEHFELQIVIATHSTSLLASLGQFGGPKTSVIYLNRITSNYTAQKFGSIQKELAACLGGHVLMGPLFGSPILLVEGDDDYRIWSQVPRHHIANFSVIPSNGEEIKKYQKTLESIFGSLRDEGAALSGFALLDGDTELPLPSPENTQNHIRFIRLHAQESENLYLADEVLSDMGLTWEQAKVKIKERAGQYGNKQHFLQEIDSWDRQKTDIKSVVNEVADILDTKSLPWTVRLGKCLGKTKPHGQLAEFLGPTVIRALWAGNSNE